MRTTARPSRKPAPSRRPIASLARRRTEPADSTPVPRLRPTRLLAAGLLLLLAAAGLLNRPASALALDLPTYAYAGTLLPVSDQPYCPEEIAADAAGNLYVADESVSDGIIKKYSPTGAYLGAIGEPAELGLDSSQGEKAWISGMEVAANGEIFASDGRNDCVYRFGPNGHIIGSWGYTTSSASRLYSPGDLAIAPDGTVCVLDTYKDRVMRFTPSGSFLASYANAGPDGIHFDMIESLDIDSDGNLFVNDIYSIYKLSPTGAFIASSQGAYSLGISSSGTMADDSGGFFVPDYYGNIRHFNASMTPIGSWDMPPYGDGSRPDYCDYFARDGSGNIYVVDGYKDVVRKFSEAGNLLNEWRAFGFGPGDLRWPEGLAQDESGRVIVADIETNKLLRFSAAGNYLDGWGTTGYGPGLFSGPGSLCRAAGLTYVADHGNGLIAAYNDSGACVRSWGGKGTGNGKFNDLVAISLDTAGYVYALDSSWFEYDDYDVKHPPRLQKFTPSGAFLSSLPLIGLSTGSKRRAGKTTSKDSDEDDSTYYDDYSDIALDSSGNIYLSACGWSYVGSDYSYIKLSPKGKYLGRGIATNYYLDSSASIVVTSAGYVITGNGAGDIACYDPAGRESGNVFGPAFAAFAHWESCELSLAPDGDLLIALPAVHNVIRYDKTVTKVPGAPVITSPSHPDAAKWYASNEVSFSFSCNDNPQGGALSYRSAISRTTNSASLRWRTETTAGRSFTDLGNGTWYLAVRAVDSLGHTSPIAWRRVKVDSLKPVVSLGSMGFFRSEPGCNVYLKLRDCAVVQQTVDIKIRLHNGRYIRTLAAGKKLNANPIGRDYKFWWNGWNSAGKLVPAGKYDLVAVVSDPAGNKSVTVKTVTVSP